MLWKSQFEKKMDLFRTDFSNNVSCDAFSARKFVRGRFSWPDNIPWKTASSVLLRHFPSETRARQILSSRYPKPPKITKNSSHPIPHDQTTNTEYIIYYTRSHICSSRLVYHLVVSALRNYLLYVLFEALLGHRCVFRWLQ